MNTKKINAIDYLENRFGPLSLGDLIKAIREADAITQTEFAARLKISRANLCDIEKNRKLISPERAVKFAKRLQQPEKLFIKLSLLDILRKYNLKYEIELIAS